jgi:hypothetical protein
MARREAKRIAFPNIDFEKNQRSRSQNETREPVSNTAEPELVKPVEQIQETPHLFVETDRTPKVHKSFFDEIG